MKKPLALAARVIKIIIVLLSLIPTLSFAQQPETPPQLAGRWEVYCVSRPPAQRAECREQARAAVQLYSANYYAAKQEESRRRTEETLRKLRETPPRNR